MSHAKQAKQRRYAGIKGAGRTPASGTFFMVVLRRKQVDTVHGKIDPLLGLRR